MNSPTITPSAHPNSGVDYHLRMIKIDDRADWDIVSIDRKRLETVAAHGRPDFIVRHKSGHRYKVVDYKSRSLGESGLATPYELYEVILYAMLLKEMVRAETGEIPEVEAQLLYGDNEIVTVEFTQEDERRILEKSLEARTALFFHGLHEGSDERPSVTKLARYLVDPEFKDTAFGWTAAQVAGSKAHSALSNLGPKVIH